MTKRKQMAHALSMPNLLNGNLTRIITTDKFVFLQAEKDQTDSVARVRASEVDASARAVGVFLSVEDRNLQERYERILSREESHLYDILYGDKNKNVV